MIIMTISDDLQVAGKPRPTLVIAVVIMIIAANVGDAVANIVVLP